MDVKLEELQLAWERVKRDRQNRSFANHPYLVPWIEKDRDSWLTSIQSRLRAGHEPKQAQMAFVPKAGFLHRAATILDLEDEVAYNLILGRIYSKIHAAISNHEGDPDMAYPFARSDSAINWIRSDFIVWNKFRQRSHEKLTNQVSYVAVADIAGFYDNIDLGRMITELRRHEISGPELDLLSKCLNRWAEPRGKGIPQGYSASDILAKVYCYHLDAVLKRKGINHLRYVDDIRIFCGSQTEAKTAILRLCELCHRCGLSLQSAKTKILTKTEAHLLFEGVAPVIGDIQVKLQQELTEQLDGSPYIPEGEMLNVLEDFDGRTPDVLERTFTENFVSASDTKFDKTLFHYLLTRLEKSGSAIAVDYCLGVLMSHPEETQYVLRYFTVVEFEEHHLTRLIDYMGSKECSYDYQRFQFVKWFFSENIDDSRVLGLCRKWAFDLNRFRWLRSYALAFLGKFGQGADFDLLEEQYSKVETDLERADIVASLSKQTPMRRNSFYRRIASDGELVSRAIKVVKEGM